MVALVKDDEGECSDRDRPRVDEGVTKDLGGPDEDVVRFQACPPLRRAPSLELHTRQLRHSYHPCAELATARCLLRYEHAGWYEEHRPASTHVGTRTISEEVVDSHRGYERFPGASRDAHDGVCRFDPA